jgi:hypothetical protein
MRHDPKAAPSPLLWLVDLARDLTGDAVAPIDLGALLDSLRVDIEFCPDAKTPGVTKPTSRTYKVVLPGTASSDGLSNRQRFSVAHELAHVLLDYQYGIRPTDEAEHREVERWCDHFASELLVPEKAVASFHARSWREMYERMSALAGMYQVSMEVVARRIARRKPTLVIARLSESTNIRGERVLRVQWCAGDKQGLRIHRGTHISGDHSLGAFLDSLGRASSKKIEVRGRILQFHAIPRGPKALLLAANTAHST